MISRLSVSIGRGIRRAREIAGLTLEEVAARTGFGLAYLTKMEGGDGTVGLLHHIVEKYAVALGFPPSLIELLGVDPEDMQSVSPEVVDKLTTTLCEMLAHDAQRRGASRARVARKRVRPRGEVDTQLADLRVLIDAVEAGAPLRPAPGEKAACERMRRLGLLECWDSGYGYLATDEGKRVVEDILRAVGGTSGPVVCADADERRER